MDTSINPQYLKGFNHAYLLTRHKPELIRQLLNNPIDNEYFQGIKDGNRTFEQEQLKNKTQNRLQELNQLPLKNDKDQNQER